MYHTQVNVLKFHVFWSMIAMTWKTELCKNLVCRKFYRFNRICIVVSSSELSNYWMLAQLEFSQMFGRTAFRSRVSVNSKFVRRIYINRFSVDRFHDLRPCILLTIMCLRKVRSSCLKKKKKKKNVLKDSDEPKISLKTR